MRFLNYLSFQNKFVLTFTVVAIPIVISFMGYANDIYKQLDRTQAELDGVALLKAVNKQLGMPTITQPLKWDATLIDVPERQRFEAKLFAKQPQTFEAVHAWQTSIVEASNLIVEPDNVPYTLVDSLFLQLLDMKQYLYDLKPYLHNTAQLPALESRLFLKRKLQSLYTDLGIMTPDLTTAEVHTITEKLKTLEASLQPLLPTSLKNAPLTLTQIDAVFKDIHALESLFYSMLTTCLKNRINALPIPFFQAMGMTLLGLGLSAVMLVLLRRSLQRRIEALRQALSDFNEGRLNAPVTLASNDELNLLADEFNRVRQNFTGVVQHLLGLSHSLHTASNALQGNSYSMDKTIHKLEQTSKINTDVVERVSHHVEDVASFISQVQRLGAHLTEQGNALQQQAQHTEASNQQVYNGLGVVLTDVQQVNEDTATVYAVLEEIQSELVQVGQSSTNVQHTSGDISAKLTQCLESNQALVERLKSIQHVVTELENLSNQTNLLALNASIEASLATSNAETHGQPTSGVKPQHAAGFMVVAQEVKDLAKKSLQATANIHNEVAFIHRYTHQVSGLLKEGCHAIQIVEASSQKNQEYLHEQVARLATSNEHLNRVHSTLKHIKESTAQVYQQVASSETSHQQVQTLVSELMQQLSTLSKDITKAQAGLDTTKASSLALQEADKALSNSLYYSEKHTANIRDMSGELTSYSQALGKVLEMYNV
jgi:methyl-accepting chemotaxis protein